MSVGENEKKTVILPRRNHSDGIMATHNRLGKAGEDAAVAYLERHEYVIRHRNWRKGHLELDIVAAKHNVLVIVEVKTRSNTEVIEPFEAVGGLKKYHLMKAADAYVKEFGLDGEIRFDIITLVGEADNFHLEHIKDAFYLI